MSPPSILSRLGVRSADDNKKTLTQGYTLHTRLPITAPSPEGMQLPQNGPSRAPCRLLGTGVGVGGCLGVEPAGGPCLGLEASGLLGLRSGNACVCPVRGGRGREGTSFPLGTPLPIHRLLADTHTAAWVVCKVGIYDKEAGEGWKWAFTGVFHGDLASV